MAGVNDFLPFAIAGGANVVDQATWAGLPAVDDGFSAGIAESAQLNKAWRQPSTMAAVIARFIVDRLPAQDVLDDGDPDVIVGQLLLAVQMTAITLPARLVTSSANFTATAADGIIGFNRTAAVAAQQVTLPNGMAVGQQMAFQDVVGNFFNSPLTLVPPAGQISGLANFVLKVDKGTAIVTYYGTNIYGVQSS